MCVNYTLFDDKLFFESLSIHNKDPNCFITLVSSHDINQINLDW